MLKAARKHNLIKENPYAVLIDAIEQAAQDVGKNVLSFDQQIEKSQKIKPKQSKLIMSS